MGRKNKYSNEFKLQAVKLAMMEGNSIAGVASELGVSDTGLGRWVHLYKEKGAEAFGNDCGLTPQETEIRRLRKELEQVKMERDILKEATAFFVKQSK